MKQKSWHIDRRTMLRGMGATIALPFLDSMAWAKGARSQSLAARKRFCAVYFPFGAPAAIEGRADEKWGWTPKMSRDGSYEFREIMKPLTPLKDRVTVFKGLSHNRNMGAHDSADGFLTGTPIIGGKGKNTISLDQVIAEKYGEQTRFSSMVLGLDGGIGQPSASHTLSYNRDGLPIPSLSKLRPAFDSMFSAATQQQMAKQLKRKKSILDATLESSKDLSRKLGKMDQAKLDEYLGSIRQLEKRIQKQEAWLSEPMPDIDTSKLALDATLEEPKEYLESMFDLMFLAFQTDMTRTATFQIGSQKHAGVSMQLTSRLGMGNGHHNLAHAMNKANGPENLGKYLQYLTSLYANFLERLKNTSEGSGSMLDNTLTLYGCSNSVGGTHATLDLPLIIGGGEALGFKQGQYLEFDRDVPLTNLYLTILERFETGTPSFADSTGTFSNIVRS